MAFNTAVGDLQPAAEICPVASLPLSQRTVLELEDINNPSNDAQISGKRQGAMYVVQTDESIMDIAIAYGSAPADPWVYLSSVNLAPRLPQTTSDDMGTAGAISYQHNQLVDVINKILDGKPITPIVNPS